MNRRVNDDSYLAINQANWDARVPLHLQGYNLKKYADDPTALSDVVRFDIPRLGNVEGLRGIHLQCHIGTDTISLARRGAEMVGLDLSGASIAAARDIAEMAGNHVLYVQSDVYAAPQALEIAGIPANFDFVFTGVGALCWLPDVNRWARVVADLLKPGGFLFIREGHPMMWAMGDDLVDGQPVLGFNYFAGPGTLLEEEFSYAGEGTVASPASVAFNHGMAEIITALMACDLELSLFEEHQSAPWNPFGEACELVGEFDEWQLREEPARLAMTYTIKAFKK